MKRVLAAVCLSLAAFVPVAAFQFSPMSSSIDPTTSLPTTTFEARNGTGDPIAVQLRVVTRQVAPDGTETNRDASEQFQIFPSQLILRPGQVQSVRVRWLGPRDIEEELPFRIVAEQLPINLSREQADAAGVRFLLRYRTTLYIRPPGVEAEVSVTDIAIDTETEELIVEVTNTGTRHQLLSDGIVEFWDGAQSFPVPSGEIEAIASVNLLPGTVRRVRVPLADIPVQPDRITFRF